MVVNQPSFCSSEGMDFVTVGITHDDFELDGSKLKSRGYAGLGLCFQLRMEKNNNGFVSLWVDRLRRENNATGLDSYQGVILGTIFLSHSHFSLASGMEDKDSKSVSKASLS